MPTNWLVFDRIRALTRQHAIYQAERTLQNQSSLDRLVFGSEFLDVNAQAAILDQTNLQINRLERYKDYEQMDQMGEISLALDLYCLSGDTRIPLLDGTCPTIAELAVSGCTQFWIYGLDAESGSLKPAMARLPHVSGRNAELVRVAWDDGYIDCTKSHKFHTKRGWICASDLMPGDSLTPVNLIRHCVPPSVVDHRVAQGIRRGYEAIQIDGAWRLTHQWVYGHVQKGEVIHHKDVRRKNNEPTNLEAMLWDEHKHLHEKMGKLPPEIEEQRRLAVSTALKKKWQDSEYRAKMQPHNIARGKQLCKSGKAFRGGSKPTTDWDGVVAIAKALGPSITHDGLASSARISCATLDRMLVRNNLRWDEFKSSIISVKHEIGRGSISAIILKYAVEMVKAGLDPRDWDHNRSIINRNICTIPTERKVLEHYSLDDLSAIAGYNHTVRSVTPLSDKADKVYDMYVDDGHAFAAGTSKSWVIVHNSDEGCTSGDTRIPLLDGTCPTIAELAEKGVDHEFWVYAYDTKQSRYVPTKAKGARISGTNMAIIKITFDDGSSIRCTGDHLFLLYNNEWARANDLKHGDNLRPFCKEDLQKTTKVISIEACGVIDKVYDIEVPQYHCFAAGDHKSWVIIHNSLVDPERKHTIVIRARNRRLKKELESLFFDTLLWDAYCRPSIRYLCKYGDLPFEIILNTERSGISSLRFMNVYNFTRIETRFGDLVGFFFQNVLYPQPQFMHPWQVMHLRLTSFENIYHPYGRCLRWGTRVPSPRGYKNVEDFKKGDDVYVFDGTALVAAKVVAACHSGKKPILKIKTKHCTNECSHEHPILVRQWIKRPFKFGEKWFAELIYKRADEIRVGDELVIPRLPTTHQQEIELPAVGTLKHAGEVLTNIHADHLSSLQHRLTIPRYVDVNFAELFGFLIGDGWIRQSNSYVEGIDFALGQYAEINSKYESLLVSYGLKPKRRKVSGSKSKLPNDACSASSVDFGLLMVEMGLCSGFDKKRVPQWIYQAKPEIQQAFMNGLVDADGSTNIDEWGCERYQLELSNYELIKDVKMLLHQMGWKCSNIIERERDPNIATIHERSDSWIIYFYKADLFESAGKHVQKESGSRGYNARKKESSKFGEDVIFESVIAIEDGGVHETADIQVDHQASNFVADGIVVHNCADLDSKVLTPGGYKCLGDIRPHDVVYSFNGLQPVPTTVTNVAFNTIKPSVTLSTKHRSFTVSEDHPVLAVMRGAGGKLFRRYVLAKHVVPGSIITTHDPEYDDPNSYMVEEVVGQKAVGLRQLGDIQVNSGYSNFIADGAVIHNSIIDGGRKAFKQLRLMEDAALIYRICLRGDQLVWAADGHKPIKDIKIGDMVYCFKDGRPKLTKVVSWMCNGKDVIYRVASQHREIYCNATHPILVEKSYANKQKGEKSARLEYVDVKDLIVKRNSIASHHRFLLPQLQHAQYVRLRLPVVPTYARLKAAVYVERGPTSLGRKVGLRRRMVEKFFSGDKWLPEQSAKLLCAAVDIDDDLELKQGWVYDAAKNICDECNLPEYIDEDFAKLFGFMIGDGYASRRRSNNKRGGSHVVSEIGIALGDKSSTNSEYIDRFNRYFGGYRAADDRSNGDGKFYRNSKHLYDLMLLNGFIPGAANKRIPGWVYLSPRSVQEAFIEGYIAADVGGWKLKNINAKSESCEIECCNEMLTKDFKELFNRLGWESGLVRKRERQNGHEIEPGRIMPPTTSWCLYFTKKQKHEMDYVVHAGERYSTASEAILSVEEVGEDLVYDITVEDEVHNFIAQSIPVGNTRAPEKRKFIIPVGLIPPKEVPEYMQMIARNFKRQRFYNPSTGTFDERYSPLIQEDDFLLPRRCMPDHQRVVLLDGRTRTLAELINEYGVERDQFWVYSWDNQTQNIVPGLAQCVIGPKAAKIARITLDDGSVHETTVDHLFYMSNGATKQAQDLRCGDSLLAFYRRKEKLRSGRNVGEYEQVRNPITGQWEFTHRIVSPICPNGFVRHHKDFDRFNNCPTNLELLDIKKHKNLHAAHGHYIMRRLQSDPKMKMKFMLGTQNGIVAYNKSERAVIEHKTIRAKCVSAKWRNGDYQHTTGKNHAQYVDLDGYCEILKQIVADCCGQLKPACRKWNKLYGHIWNANKTTLAVKITEWGYNSVEEFCGREPSYNQLTDKQIVAGITTYGSMAEFRRQVPVAPSNGTCTRAVQRMGYHSVADLLHQPTNHKVISVEVLNGVQDTFCLEVENYHNFMLPSGIIVHNSDGSGPDIETLPGAENLDQIADIEYFKKKMIAPTKIPYARVGIGEGAGEASEKSLSQSHSEFAKAVQWVQREVATGLKKVAIVHLALRGYGVEDLRGFDIALTATSAMEELYRIETWQTRVGVMADLKDLGWFPKEWIVTHFTDLSPDEIEELNDMENTAAQGGPGGGSPGGLDMGGPMDGGEGGLDELGMGGEEGGEGGEGGEEPGGKKQTGKPLEGFDYDAQRRLLLEMRKQGRDKEARAIVERWADKLGKPLVQESIEPLSGYDHMLNSKELDGLSKTNVQIRESAGDQIHDPNNDEGLLVEWSVDKESRDEVIGEVRSILVQTNAVTDDDGTITNDDLPMQVSEL